MLDLWVVLLKACVVCVTANDEFIKSLVVIEDDVREILIACENGFGKRTFIDEFNTQNRGGGGVIAIKTSQRNGALVRATKVEPGR